MINPDNIRISDYDYPLPDERIAKYPLAERDSSKLLIYNKGVVSEDHFYSLPKYLPKGALMVFNNTKVIQARLHFQKQTGAVIEVFCLEPYVPHDYVLTFQATGQCEWLCMIGNLKRWKDGELERDIEVKGTMVTLRANRLGPHGTSHIVRFSWDGQYTWADILEAVGELPIPPYLNRPTEASDLRTYQTVYSKIKGSVAAPTAGLHFTPSVLADIDAAGIERDEVTLHVGAGTFRPVKSDTIAGHDMHSEYIVVRRSTIEKLLSHGCQAIAVGTTSVRTLESLYYIGRKILLNPEIAEDGLHVDQWEPYAQAAECSVADSLKAIVNWMDANHTEAIHTSTQIIIVPGYTYKIVGRIVTNFHQPQSTLLLLVSAFIGDDWHRVYDYALSHDFRFLSYGDSSLLIP